MRWNRPYIGIWTKKRWMGVYLAVGQLTRLLTHWQSIGVASWLGESRNDHRNDYRVWIRWKLRGMGGDVSGILQLGQCCAARWPGYDSAIDCFCKCSMGSYTQKSPVVASTECVRQWTRWLDGYCSLSARLLYSVPDEPACSIPPVVLKRRRPAFGKGGSCREWSMAVREGWH